MIAAADVVEAKINVGSNKRIEIYAAALPLCRRDIVPAPKPQVVAQGIIVSEVGRIVLGGVMSEGGARDENIESQANLVVAYVPHLLQPGAVVSFRDQPPVGWRGG